MKRKQYFTILILFLFQSLLIAQTHIFNGNGGNSDWFNSANWDTGTVPSSTSDVLIPNASVVEISAAMASVHSIELSGNSTLQITNNIAFSDQFQVASGSNILWLKGRLSGGGIIENDGIIQMETFDEKIIDNITLNNNGLIYITNTSLNRATNGAILNNNESGIIEIDSVGGWTQSEPGCTLNNAGLITKVNDGNNFSTFYLIFDIFNSGTIHAGENQTILMLGLSMTLRNMASGIISGTGIFDITAIFFNDGTFSPGDNLEPGTMEVVNVFTFQTDSTLKLDIAGPNPGEYDVAAIFGFPTLEGIIAVDLHYAPQLGDEFEVITANNITACNLAETTTAVYDGVEYTFLIECNQTDVTLRASESTLGFTDFSSEEIEFFVYPNPVKETIHISLHTSEGFAVPYETLSLSIYNILGQELKTISNFSEANNSFERGSLTSGMYFLKLHSESNVLAATQMVLE